MLLSKDRKVAAIGFSPEESIGLDVAIAELRRVIGPMDAYVATYARNGMNGPTVIFGKRVAHDKSGRPFLTVKKVQGRHVLGFSMQGDDRNVVQKITGRSTWKQVIDKETFPLESIAANSKPFASRMKELGYTLKGQHPDFYELRIAGKSQMPSSYTDTVTTQPSGSQLLRDMKEIDELKSLSPPVRKQLIEARVGQGKFRRQVLEKWDECCAVTGCKIPELLRASHVQPWAYRPKQDQLLPGREPRLDPSNGLPLVSVLDALFDSGLMTFDEDGHAHFVDSHMEKQLSNLGLLPEDIRLKHAPDEELKHYLRIHHSVVFLGTLSPKKGKNHKK